jgi:hypothetical protein
MGENGKGNSEFLPEGPSILTQPLILELSMYNTFSRFKSRIAKLVQSYSSSKTKKWRKIRKAFSGKRAFLIGNGPSLNKTPLHLLKNEFTLCFNLFNLMFDRVNWRPSMYMCVDDRVAEDCASTIREIIPLVRYAFFPDVHPGGSSFHDIIDDADNIYWLSLEWDGFFSDLPRVGLGGTVANVGLQVLCYLGFSPIYLVGVDMDYKDHPSAIKHDSRNWTSVRNDDPNHFDPRYFGKDSKYHYPRLKENMMPSMERAKRETGKMGVEVFNAGVGGELEVFPRVDFHSLFRVTEEEELALFLDNMGISTGFSSLNEAFPGLELLENPDDFDPDKPLVMTDLETGVKLIPQIIFTHIPRGPIGNRYLMKQRRKETA